MPILKTIKNLLTGINNILNKTEEKVKRRIISIEHMILITLNRIKRKLFTMILELVLITLSIIFLSTAAILFFSKFFSLEIIFFVAGLLFLYFALLFRLVR